MITSGSLFSGIGGFELGADWAFKKAQISHKVLFQVEQNKYCRGILNKHWPDAIIHDDVKLVGKHNLPKVDILMGGFPCQDISLAGKQKGIKHGKKSILWYEMLRIIGELRPSIVVLENVPAILSLGGASVIAELASIGYDSRWTIISAQEFGAPHIRKRWFCIATNTNSDSQSISAEYEKASRLQKPSRSDSSDSPSTRSQRHSERTKSLEKERLFIRRSCQNSRRNIANAWEKFPSQSPLCSRDDGIPDRLARLKALGNAIVPQCSEYIFSEIIKNIL